MTDVVGKGVVAVIVFVVVVAAVLVAVEAGVAVVSRESVTMAVVAATATEVWYFQTQHQQ